jgi:gamma-glutamyltranspeptidase
MINHEFGSNLISSTGIVLNNGMDNFLTPPRSELLRAASCTKNEKLILSVGVCLSNFIPTS